MSLSTTEKSTPADDELMGMKPLAKASSLGRHGLSNEAWTTELFCRGLAMHIKTRRKELGGYLWVKVKLDDRPGALVPCIVGRESLAVLPDVYC